MPTKQKPSFDITCKLSDFYPIHSSRQHLEKDSGMALPQTALAFAQEVIGYEFPQIRTVPGIARPFVRDDFVKGTFFHTDLNAVLEAVRAWHRKNGLFMAMYFYPQIDAVMVAIFDDNMTVEAEEADPCHALMLACLRAARKLREAA